MTRAEWLDYFETVNGRKPSVQEMADALKAGEFVNEGSVKTQEPATAEPIKVAAEIVETSTNPVPTEVVPVVQASPTVAFSEGQAAMANLALKKGMDPKKKKRILVSIVSAVALVFLCIGGFMTYRYVTGNIDGKWYSSSLGREYSSSMSESLTDLESQELEKYITDTAVTMKVKGSNAKVTASYTFDKKTYIKDYRDSLEKTFSTFGDLFKAIYGDSFESYYSEETIEKELDDALEKAAKDSGQKYDSKTGETTTTLFKGKVSRLGHKMTVTSVNKDVDIDGLNVKKGQELKVTKKDNKVTLSGDGKSKDITFSTKNDTKDKF
ncbi:hypothetical protein [uncultured Streptococcus sp.]|uniref:hypothetical protein n=1 Tax=uncultured Streptococcus sp. TaxID=83427 RepID=UPI0028DB382B|nr:hypothetical protein [uncultured Streptococcus sp.]